MLRRTSPYAAHLPEDIFLNYVLHPRVNEEELSDCRRAMYDELSPLLAGLPEYQAAVRVNYWNVSQVTYRLTDDRTISAAAAWRCGFGRCGEESTFAVNAYRAVGIPARQIYTPRWAHCDDNHAWVEVWVDGSWHFLGAVSRRRLWTGAGSQRRQPGPCCCIPGALETPWGRKLFPEAAW